MEITSKKLVAIRRNAQVNYNSINEISHIIRENTNSFFLLFKETKVNCQWDSWTIFDCTKTCGGGKRVKTRSKLVNEVGTACKGLATMQESCNTEECPGKLALYE